MSGVPPIHPYKRTPVAPTVALLTADATVIDEHGGRLELDRLPEGVRIWVDYDTVRELVTAGAGEALCWNGEEIKWRHRRHEQGWRRRASDVHVIRLPFYTQPERTLRALAAWRDWLARYGAAPTSTTGGAAWSLLRATLEETLWPNVGQTPPLLQTIGGRQELGPAGAGDFHGRLVLLDLSAAYATELGNLPYGGRWHQASSSGVDQPPEWWALNNRPIFCRARVTLAGTAPGPLVRKPRRRIYGLEAMLLGSTYPTAGTIQGVWTWQELETARRHGARVRVLETWAHIAGEKRPFDPWWTAILEGRTMPGLAGQLAKTTGNALWGQFCMDAAHNGARTIKGVRGRAVEVRELARQAGRPPAHDLAETISGRTRAKLYDLMAAAGDALLTAHTDGAWIDAARSDPIDDELLELWRVKASARRLELLNPQGLRYHTTRDVRTVWAGVPASQADESFDAALERRLEMGDSYAR